MNKYMKSVISALKHWVTSQKSDWNQNDPTAANFVKNRPFYESTEVLFDQRVEFYEENGMGGFAGEAPEALQSLVNGETYIVTYNGIAYNCVCFNGSLGNFLIYGMEDTGEPFAIIITDDDGNGEMDMIVADYNGAASATIRIEKSVIHPIDPKFLPGGGGGSGDMVVAIDVATMTPSRTYDEIVSALRSGCNARIQCNLPTNDGTGNVYAMIAPCMGEGRDCVNFISFTHNNDQAASLLTFVLSKDNTITAREGTVLFADGINNA